MELHVNSSNGITELRSDRDAAQYVLDMPDMADQDKVPWFEY